MKKMLRLLLSSAVLAAMFAGMQITAFAAVGTSSYIDEVSRPANETTALNDTARATETSVPGGVNETSPADHETSRLNEMTTNEINPISANPRTGAENIAIPAVVALLAASTAAIALSSKKRR